MPRNLSNRSRDPITRTFDSMSRWRRAPRRSRVLAGCVVVALVAGAFVAARGGERAVAAGPVTLRPVDGGPSYFARWSNSLPTDPGFFPISVWAETLGTPSDAAKYAELGINGFVVLWNGYSPEIVSALQANGQWAMTEDWSLSGSESSVQKGTQWFDEPELFSACSGSMPQAMKNVCTSTPGGDTPPGSIQAMADIARSLDPTRPVYGNFMKFTAFEGLNWPFFSRGDAADYVRAVDVVSYDEYIQTDANVYPHETWNKLWLQYDIMKNVRSLAGFSKPVWAFIGTSEVFGDAVSHPSPAQITTEAWHAIIGGARGIEWFNHNFYPGKESQHVLIEPDYAPVANAVSQTNARITELAPVLNAPFAENLVSVTNGDVNQMAKAYNGSYYLFAAPRSQANQNVTFNLNTIGNATATVLYENRTVPVTNGNLTDNFANDTAVHIYRIDPTAPPTTTPPTTTPPTTTPPTTTPPTTTPPTTTPPTTTPPTTTPPTTTPPPGNSQPPAVAATSPTPGATSVSPTPTPVVTARFTEPVQPATVSFALTDAGRTPVASTITYDASTNTSKVKPTEGLAPLKTYTATVSGAKDLSGTAMVAPTVWSFTTSSSGQPTCPCTLFSPSTVPGVPATPDNSAVELGVKFRSAVPGLVTGVRFYKGAGNIGTHRGSLWTTNGSRLATATFTNETASGWQQVSFSKPVAIDANVNYVVSYFAPAGHYSGERGYFANAVRRGPLYTPADSESSNGVYRYGGSSGFPAKTFVSSNYWVDVVFTASDTPPPPPPSDTTPPELKATRPVRGSTTIQTSTSVTATFNEVIQPGTATITLRGPGSVAVPARWRYDAETNRVILRPTSLLAARTTYTATVSGATDLAGNTMATTSWSFTTRAG